MVSALVAISAKISGSRVEESSCMGPLATLLDRRPAAFSAQIKASDS